MQKSERNTVIMLSEKAEAEDAGSLPASTMERYRRQLMLNGFTEAHQRKLGDSTALIAGIGGLGGTAALYLAVAGIGKMIFAHAGNLTLSNMNRQILMENDWIGE